MGEHGVDMDLRHDVSMAAGEVYASMTVIVRRLTLNAEFKHIFRVFHPALCPVLGRDRGPVLAFG